MVLKENNKKKKKTEFNELCSRIYFLCLTIGWLVQRPGYLIWMKLMISFCQCKFVAINQQWVNMTHQQFYYSILVEIVRTVIIELSNERKDVTQNIDARNTNLVSS